jgi:hypothetical protein
MCGPNARLRELVVRVMAVILSPLTMNLAIDEATPGGLKALGLSERIANVYSTLSCSATCKN